MHASIFYQLYLSLSQPHQFWTLWLLKAYMKQSAAMWLRMESESGICGVPVNEI